MRLKFKQKNRTLGKPKKVNLNNILQLYCIYKRNVQFTATPLDAYTVFRQTLLTR